MNRNNINQKSYTMESDDEDDVSPSINQNNIFSVVLDRKHPIHKINQTSKLKVI